MNQHPASWKVVKEIRERFNKPNESFGYRDVQACLNIIDDLQTGCQLTLDFHSGRLWTDEQAKLWEEKTGTREATTKTLCDTIRRLME